MRLNAQPSHPPRAFLQRQCCSSAAPRLRGAAGPWDQIIPACSLQWNLAAASLLCTQSLLSSGNICSHRYNIIYGCIKKAQNLNVPKQSIIFPDTAAFIWSCSSSVATHRSYNTEIPEDSIPCCSTSSASLWLIKYTSMKEPCTSA